MHIQFYVLALYACDISKLTFIRSGTSKKTLPFIYIFFILQAYSAKQNQDISDHIFWLVYQIKEYKNCSSLPFSNLKIQKLIELFSVFKCDFKEKFHFVLSLCGIKPLQADEGGVNDCFLSFFIHRKVVYCWLQVPQIAPKRFSATED